MTPTLPRTLFVGHGTGGVNWYRCVLPATALDADYQVAGVADANQDGHADLIIEQGSTGALFYAVQGPSGFDHWETASWLIA